MLQCHARAAQAVRRDFIGNAGSQRYFAQDLFQVFTSNAAGPQNRRGRLRQVEHGRFHAHRRRSRVQNHVDLIAQIRDDMIGACRTGTAKTIRAGRGDRQVRRGQQRLSHRMPRHP
jgi:hypothetical protein